MKLSVFVSEGCDQLPEPGPRFPTPQNGEAQTEEAPRVLPTHQELSEQVTDLSDTRVIFNRHVAMEKFGCFSPLNKDSNVCPFGTQTGYIRS